MSTLATISLEPRAIPLIVKQVQQWSRKDRVRLLQELHETVNAEEIVEDEEGWQSNDSINPLDAMQSQISEITSSLPNSEKERIEQFEQQVQELWAMLPANAGSYTDAELDEMKVAWRMEKYG